MTSSFTKLVNEYNEDYVALLQRASKGNYQRLLFSFRVLKDLYDVIQLLFDKRAWGLKFYPIRFGFAPIRVVSEPWDLTANKSKTSLAFWTMFR
jgi:hypothetical protein